MPHCPTCCERRRRRLFQNRFENGIHLLDAPVAFRVTEHDQLTRGSLEDPERYFRWLLAEEQE